MALGRRELTSTPSMALCSLSSRRRAHGPHAELRSAAKGLIEESAKVSRAGAFERPFEAGTPSRRLLYNEIFERF